MDVEFCMKMHVKQHKIAIDHLKEIYKSQNDFNKEMQMLPQRLSDKFYAETGVESMELD